MVVHLALTRKRGILSQLYTRIIHLNIVPCLYSSNHTMPIYHQISNHLNSFPIKHSNQSIQTSRAHNYVLLRPIHYKPSTAPSNPTYIPQTFRPTQQPRNKNKPPNHLQIQSTLHQRSPPPSQDPITIVLQTSP